MHAAASESPAKRSSELTFPFDPCQLRNAHQYVKHLYTEWAPEDDTGEVPEDTEPESVRAF